MKQPEKPIANPVVVLREEFDDWAVLFNPDTGEAVCINPVGVVVWKMMDGDHSLEKILTRIGDNFAGIPDTAADDLTMFVNDLADRGFAGYELQDADH